MKFYASFPINAQQCLNNRSMAYGDGLFETMQVTNGMIPLWEWHYQRLEAGLKRLNIDVLDKKYLMEKLQALITDNNNHVAKLVVFRGDKTRGYFSASQRAEFCITINPYVPTKLLAELTLSPVRLARQKKLAGLKHLNRLEQVLAAQALSKTSYNDALMLDSKNNMIETINKNIILIKNNRLYTPKLNNCGVYGVALRWLQAQGYELKWKKIEFKSLCQYDGFLVCNSVVGFHAMIKVADVAFNRHGLIVNEIQTKWQKYFNIL